MIHYLKKMCATCLFTRNKAVSTSRVTLLLWVLSLSSLTAGYSQNARINLSLKNERIKVLFQEIRKQSDFSFLYNNNELDDNERVSLSVQDKTVGEILDIVLRNRNLDYEIKDRTILIYRPEIGMTNSSSAQQDRKKISGRVTDAQGEVLPGVVVRELDDEYNGTVTDIDGLYNITVGVRARIEISFLGYKTVEVNVGASNIYDVILQEEVSELDELVVTGYGEQRRISSIGAQTTVKRQDIKAPSASLSTILAGRLSGVVAVQRSGEPGRDAADIWIRGLATPNSANPLILVDGVERDFNNIDPEDIESISVLKDASATAVYGVRGANGVIIVKTKPGTIGKPIVNIDYYEGVNRFTKSPELADGVTYMEAVNEALINTGRAPKYSPAYIENTRNGVDPILYPNVDWQDEVFKEWGNLRRVNANVRGGSQMAQFYASVSVYNETGTIRTNPNENYDSSTRYTRYNFTTNVNMQVTSTTEVSVGAQGYLADGNYPGMTSDVIFGSTMEVNPVMYPKMFVVDGMEYVPGVHTQGAERNPYADATKRGYRKTMSNRIHSNVRLTQDLGMITEGLKLTAMFAYDVNSGRNTAYNKRENTYYLADRNNPYDGQGNPILTTTWNQGSKVLSFGGNNLQGERKDYLEASLLYDRIFGDHRVGGMIVYTQQGRNVNHAGSIIDAIPYRLQGVAGRATYSWMDRYFGEFNIGYNGGENFPKEKRYGTFPAIGVGWVASNESFWQPLEEIVPFFKIRYTNGKAGNSTVGGRRFMYLDQYEWTGNYRYNFGGRIVDGVRVVNPATMLEWEVAHKQDLGFDVKMFNNDLSVTFDLFYEKRNQILLERSQSLPIFAGFQQVPYGNVGITRTKGFDGDLEYNKEINKDWRLTLRGNFTYADPVWIDNDIPDKAYPWRNRQGSSLVSQEGFTATGLYTHSDIDVIQAWLASEKTTTQPFPTPYNTSLAQLKPGDIIYKDMNEDGKIDDSDISWIGNGDIPKINYGFGFNLEYKAISLGMLFQGTAQANRFVGGIVKPFNDAGTGNVYSNITDRWTEDNPRHDVFYPRLAYGNDQSGNQNNFVNSTWWLKDMSFLRLKTLQVNYRLPDTWCQRVGVNGANIYLMGMNLFTYSKWKLWDPELNTGNGNSYPNSSSYTLGINFNF